MKAKIIIGTVLLGLAFTLGLIVDQLEFAVPLAFLALVGGLLYYSLTTGLVFKRDEIKIASDIENPKIAETIRSMRARANQLKFSGRVTLLMILVCLFAGISIFIGADQIANFSREEELEKTEERILDHITNKIATVYTEDPVILHDYKTAVNQLIEKYAKLEGEELYQFNDIDMEEISYNLTRKLQNKIEKAVPEDLIKEIRNELVLFKEEQQRLYKTGTPVIISSISTRVGAIFILLFLVQILVSMFRYSTKLAAFYEARGDVLELTGKTEEKSLLYLTEFLSPDDHDFSDTGKPPSEQAIELAKVLMTKTGKG